MAAEVPTARRMSCPRKFRSGMQTVPPPIPIIAETAPAMAPSPAQTGRENERGVVSWLGLRRIMSKATSAATTANTATRIKPLTIPPSAAPIRTPTRIDGPQNFRS